MVNIAAVLVLFHRLAIFALGQGLFTAVRVSVKHVVFRAKLPAWRRIESHIEDVAPIEGNRVWESRGFKPHLLCLIVTLILLKYVCVHWSEILFVHITRSKVRQVLDWIAWPRFVQRIIPYDVRIVR